MRQLNSAFCVLMLAASGLLTAANAAAQQRPRSVSPNGGIETILMQIADAFEKSDAPTARILVTKALKTAPNNAAVQTFAGVLADGAGDYQTAEKHFALAARIAPASPETRNNYGAILLRLNRPKEAAREFEASLKINSEQPSALVNLARIRFAENDLRKSRELFEKAKTIKPDAEILRALIVTSLRLKETERAKNDFREYAPKAAETKSSARIELAAILLENELADEAVQESKAVFAFDESNLDATILLAKAYLQQKNIKAAGLLLESAVARGVDDARIYMTLAEVYRAGKYWENAVPAMRLAIEKEPRNENYLVRYGLLLIDAKTPAAAAIRLEEALKEFPNSAQLWLTLGIARYDARNPTDAQIAFRRSLAIDPKLVSAMAYSAMIGTEQGFYKESIKLYEQALAVDEKNALLHYLLADVLLNLVEADGRRIETELTTAAALDGKFAAAFGALGKFYARNNRYAEAEAALEKAVALEPNYADALYQLGLTYAKLKKSSESKETMAEFKRLTKMQNEQKDSDRRELVRRLANTRF